MRGNVCPSILCVGSGGWIERGQRLFCGIGASKRWERLGLSLHRAGAYCCTTPTGERIGGFGLILPTLTRHSTGNAPGGPVRAVGGVVACVLGQITKIPNGYSLGETVKFENG